MYPRCGEQHSCAEHLRSELTGPAAAAEVGVRRTDDRGGPGSGEGDVEEVNLSPSRKECEAAGTVEADWEPYVGISAASLLVRALHDRHLTGRLWLCPGRTAHASRALPCQPSCCRVQPVSKRQTPAGTWFPHPISQHAGEGAFLVQVVFGTILRSIFDSDLRKHQHGKSR